MTMYGSVLLDYKNFTSAADGHYIRSSGWQSNPDYRITPLMKSVTDHYKTKWEGVLMLDTGKVEGVRLELHWDGATDENGVNAYRIYINGKLYIEIENVNRNFVVTGLKPDQVTCSDRSR